MNNRHERQHQTIVAGQLVVDEQIPPRPDKPETQFDCFMEDALNALTRRGEVCCGNSSEIELGAKRFCLWTANYDKSNDAGRDRAVRTGQLLTSPD